jgi:hypothetical protein
MLKWYPELNRPDVIKFKGISDFLNLDLKTTLGKNNYLEDYFSEINLKSLFN